MTSKVSKSTDALLNPGKRRKKKGHEIILLLL